MHVVSAHLTGGRGTVSVCSFVPAGVSESCDIFPFLSEHGKYHCPSCPFAFVIITVAVARTIGAMNENGKGLDARTKNHTLDPPNARTRATPQDFEFHEEQSAVVGARLATTASFWVVA